MLTSLAEGELRAARRYAAAGALGNGVYEGMNPEVLEEFSRASTFLQIDAGPRKKQFIAEIVSANRTIGLDPKELAAKIDKAKVMRVNIAAARKQQAEQFRIEAQDRKPGTEN